MGADLVLLRELDFGVGVDGDEVKRVPAAGLDGRVRRQLVKDGREHFTRVTPAVRPSAPVWQLPTYQLLTRRKSRPGRLCPSPRWLWRKSAEDHRWCAGGGEFMEQEVRTVSSS